MNWNSLYISIRVWKTSVSVCILQWIYLWRERENTVHHVQLQNKALNPNKMNIFTTTKMKRKISLRSGDRNTWGGGVKKRLLTGCGCHGYWCGVEWMTMAGLHFLFKNGERKRDRLPTKDAGVMMAKRWRMLLLRWSRARLLWKEEGRSSGLMSLSPASSLTQACFCRGEEKTKWVGVGAKRAPCCCCWCWGWCRCVSLLPAYRLLLPAHPLQPSSVTGAYRSRASRWMTLGTARAGVRSLSSD